MQTPIKALLSLWWALVYRCWSKTSWLPSCSISQIHIHQRRSKQLLATAWTSSKDAHTREDWDLKEGMTTGQARTAPWFWTQEMLNSKNQGTYITADLWWLQGPSPASRQQWKQTPREALIGNFSHLKNSRTHQLSKLDWLDDLPRMPLDRFTPKESVDGYKQCQRETIRSQHRSVSETYGDLAHLNKWSYPQWTTHAFSHRGNESSDWITPEWRSK